MCLCGGTGRYRVNRWDWLEGGRIVSKRCPCAGENLEVSEGNSLKTGESGRTISASVLKYCGSEIAPGTVCAAPGTSPQVAG
jgi:hypothetical protein